TVPSTAKSGWRYSKGSLPLLQIPRSWRLSAAKTRTDGQNVTLRCRRSPFHVIDLAQPLAVTTHLDSRAGLVALASAVALAPTRCKRCRGLPRPRLRRGTRHA